MKVLRYIIVVILALPFGLSAQLPHYPEFEKAYQQKTRSLTGQSGPAYWQNTARYNMKIDFNPETRLVKGEVEIEYANQSPDALSSLWFKLYPNLYKKGASRKSRINERDLGDGVSITAFSLNKQSIPLDSLHIDGTNMYLNIPVINPGKKAKIKLSYHYTLNKGSHVRTGQVDDGAHFLAYFFPRIAVYDDVDGWNKIPYSGNEEFYNDFCDFNVAITVPRDFMVWATGDLSNASSVLTKGIYQKLKQAEKSDQTVDVIDSLDLLNRQVTRQQAYNTFIYKAKNVVDFAFATSNHYLWKSNSLVVDSHNGRRTRVDAVFNPKHKDYYEVIDFARKTVDVMSYRFPAWPFPYSHETVFDGLDQMEYPMMVNDNPVNDRTEAITLTDHEIFHTMFPFYMGINETKYGWMDEGWATIGEWLISPMIDSTIVDEYGVGPTGAFSGSKDETPVMTRTTELKGNGSFVNNYPKPGFGYLFIKDYLGEERFKKAIHHYISTWNGKHPIPYDFFYCMNEGAGENLDWFWKPWFFETGVLDMAIRDVRQNGEKYTVSIENKGMMPMPVDLIFTLDDGSQLRHHETIGIWKKGGPKVDIPFTSAKKVVKVELKHSHVPDKDRKDNVFILK